MTQKRIKTLALLAALGGVLSLAGCAKKAAKENEVTIVHARFFPMIRLLD